MSIIYVRLTTIHVYLCTCIQWRTGPLSHWFEYCGNCAVMPNTEQNNWIRLLHLITGLLELGQHAYWAKIHWRNSKNLLLQNHWANFYLTWHKASLSEVDSICSNEGPRPFPRGDNNEIAKIHWRNLKIFFSRTKGPNSLSLPLWEKQNMHRL